MEGATVHQINSLYIHFPFCRHLCNYCDFYKIIPQEGDYDGFEKLFYEMHQEHQRFLNENDAVLGELETLYIGGGTPSLWGKRGATYLEKLLHDSGVQLKPEGEFTLEVNPGSWTPEGIKAWRDFGINRFSLGTQSLRPDYLKLLDRIHTVEEVYETLHYFKELGVPFSVDFMLGLPWSEENKRDIKAELNDILSFEPEHLSLYILTAKAGYPHKKFLPSEEFIEQEYLLVAKTLKERGFNHYEVSNFAKAGRQSRHNLSYWKSRSVAALGPSAVGFLCETKTRYKWKSKTPRFEKEILDKDSFQLEKLYMALRIDEGIRAEDHFDTEEWNNLQKLFKKWVDEGWAELEGKSLRLKSPGFLILDGLMQQIFSAQK